eukprot:GHVH01006244.1.p1 GENE.GHVH01006244.1~~GHVH01006244.1.p1  ORF type:complete len:524 (-),score=63.13 GHVH01006244.1:110-1648(-)
MKVTNPFQVGVQCVVRVGKLNGTTVEVVEGLRYGTVKSDIWIPRCIDELPADYPSFGSRTYVVDIKLCGSKDKLYLNAPVLALELVSDSCDTQLSITPVERTLFGDCGLQQYIKYPCRSIRTSHASIPYKNKKKFVQVEAKPCISGDPFVTLEKGFNLMLFLDLEATGLDRSTDSITEMAAIARIWDSESNDWVDDILLSLEPTDVDGFTKCSGLPAFTLLVSAGPGQRPLSMEIVKLTGISDDLISREGKPLEVVFNSFERWVNWLRIEVERRLGISESLRDQNGPGGLPIWLMAHNGIQYDIPLIQYNELKAASLQPYNAKWYELWWTDSHDDSEMTKNFYGGDYIPSEASPFDDFHEELNVFATGESFLKRLRLRGVIDTLLVSRQIKGWVEDVVVEAASSSKDTFKAVDDLHLGYRISALEAPVLIDPPTKFSLACLHELVLGGPIPHAHRALADCKALLAVCESPTWKYILASDSKLAVSMSHMAMTSVKFVEVSEKDLNRKKKKFK